MISTSAAAKLLGVSVQYLRRMAHAGRVPGAIQIGEGRRSTWAFPDQPRIISPVPKEWGTDQPKIVSPEIK